MGFFGDLVGGLLSGVGSVVSAIPGVGPVAGAAINAGASALGGAVSSASKNAEARELLEYQYGQQAIENQKNRDFQRDEWTRQFNLINAYNTPLEQARRLQTAGINPAVAFGGGTSTSAGSSSGSATAPSGAHGLPAFDPSGVISTGFLSQESLMKRLQLVNEVRKSGVDARVAEQTLAPQVRAIFADASNKEVENEVKSFDRDIKKLFGAKQADADLQNALADYEVKLAEQKLKLKLGEVADQDILLKESERFLNYAKERLTDKQFDVLKIEFKYAEKRLLSEIKLANAKAREAAANAENTAFFTQLNKDERDYLVKNVHNEAARKFNEARLSENQVRLIRYAISQAAYNDEQKEIKFWNDIITSDLKEGLDIFTAYKDFKSYKSLDKARQRDIDIKMMKYQKRQVNVKSDGRNEVRSDTYYVD